MTEIFAPQLPVEEVVEAIMLLPQSADTICHSVVDVLAEGPGHLAFQDAEAVDAYVREERDPWVH